MPITKPPVAGSPSTDVATRFAAAQRKLDALKPKVEEVEASTKAARRSGVPGVRRGENSLTSRGYQFQRLFQVMHGKIPVEQARVEVDMHNDLVKHYIQEHGYIKAEEQSVLAPFCSDFLPSYTETQRKFAKTVGDVVKAGVAGLDREELAAIRKTLSWTDETAVGALVAPPQFGELIEVLRNNEVFMRAGARTIPMPPNGRIIYPRQTGASTFYYVGENQQITASEPTTGDVILQAKKGAALVKAPNELFRYSSISVEAFLREDMMKVIGLGIDKNLLEGVGSSNAPKGLINYANINTYTSTGTPADGNSGYPLQPEDVYKMIATVEEQNAVFRAWVMRPLEWTYIQNRRADAVTAGDGKGAYIFNWMRELGYNPELERESVPTLSGYPVYKSTQLSKTRTRGTGTTNNTYILAGDFEDYIVAMSPTIEFAMTQQGDTAFQNDQTWLRCLLPHDGAPRHEASWVFADNLLF